MAVSDFSLMLLQLVEYQYLMQDVQFSISKPKWNSYLRLRLSRRKPTRVLHEPVNKRHHHDWKDSKHHIMHPAVSPSSLKAHKKIRRGCISLEYMILGGLCTDLKVLEMLHISIKYITNIHTPRMLGIHLRQHEANIPVRCHISIMCFQHLI